MICTGVRNVLIGVNCAASGMYHIVVTDLERFYTRRTLDKLIQIRQLTEIKLGSIPLFISRGGMIKLWCRNNRLG